VATFTFAEIEAMLAQGHEIADDKRTAFQARLKNMLRVGYPPTTKSGKGVIARYSASDAVLFALGVELFQLGIAPAHAAKLLREQWVDIAIGITQALVRVDDEPEILLMFDPVALQDLMRSEYRRGAELDPLPLNMTILDAGIFQEMMGFVSRLGSGRRSIVSISGLIDNIRDAAVKLGVDAAEFLADLRHWADIQTADIRAQLDRLVEKADRRLAGGGDGDDQKA
jgi:hypothetical protein